VFLAAFATDDGVALDINDALALGAMRGEHRIGAILGKEDHRAVAMVRHGGNHRVGCIEYGRACGRNILDDDAFDDGQLVDRSDEVEAEVVADADIGDHCHVAHVKAEAFAQHAAPRGFETLRHRRRGGAAHCAHCVGPLQSPVSVRLP
jgi:hypothetical protein